MGSLDLDLSFGTGCGLQFWFLGNVGIRVKYHDARKGADWIIIGFAINKC